MAALQDPVAVFAGAMTPLSAAASVALAGAGFRLAQLDEDAEPEQVFADIAGALGPATCLVFGAAAFGADTALTTSRPLLGAYLNANMIAPALLAQGFATALPDDRQGLVIHLAGHELSRPAPEPFAAMLSESGLWSLTQLLAQALAPRARVNLIAAPSSAEGHVGEAVRYLLGAETVTGQMIALGF